MTNEEYKDAMMKWVHAIINGESQYTIDTIRGPLFIEDDFYV